MVSFPDSTARSDSSTDNFAAPLAVFIFRNFGKENVIINLYGQLLPYNEYHIIITLAAIYNYTGAIIVYNTHTPIQYVHTSRTSINISSANYGTQNRVCYIVPCVWIE